LDAGNPPAEPGVAEIDPALSPAASKLPETRHEADTPQDRGCLAQIAPFRIVEFTLQ
jgi:hypothetical protein